MSNSKRSISSQKRDAVDEIYLFPIEFNTATFATENATVMVEDQSDGTVLIIAGNIPGMSQYYENYEFGDDKERRTKHKFARALLEAATDYLEEYDPKTDFSRTNSGNKSLRDIYVEVDSTHRDEVVIQMWEVLSAMKREYLQFKQTHEPNEYEDHPTLEAEILRLSEQSGFPDVAGDFEDSY